MSYTIVQLHCAVETAVVAERERCAKICEEIEQDMWRAYKGLRPWDPLNPLRGDAHTQGVSDGAGQCADKIRQSVPSTSGDK